MAAGVVAVVVVVVGVVVAHIVVPYYRCMDHSMVGSLVDSKVDSNNLVQMLGSGSYLFDRCNCMLGRYFRPETYLV